MKTTVIHHSADYDGIFCREIAKKFLPEAEIIGWDFSDKPLEIPKLGSVVIMDLPVDRSLGFDFSKPATVMEKFGGVDEIKEFNSRLTWIDHHASSIASHPNEIPGYRIDGVAACRLAWQWFIHYTVHEPIGNIPPSLPQKEDFINRKVNEPLAVRLAGEYDIWDKRDPSAELFQHGLRSQDLSPNDWHQLLSNADFIVQRLLDQGKCLQYAQKRQDEFIAKNRSFDVEFEGLKFMAINAVRCNSLTFEAATRPDHDALLGFYWNGKEWNVSMYHAPHRKDLDLSAIAVRYGGGGHRGACGFRTAKLPFIP